MLRQQWSNSIEAFNKGCIVPTGEWDTNTEANLKRLNKKNSIWNFERTFVSPNDKAAVIVGASPCLKRDVEILKKCTRKDFAIFSVNSALKYLLSNGVKPDYVVALDSDDHDIHEHLDVDSSKLTLICSNVVSPRVIDDWKGKVWFFPYLGMKKELRPKVGRRLGKSLPVGGNTLNTTVSMAVNIFGARIIILVASECCYSKYYYVDKRIARNNNPATEFYVNDVDGNRRVTTTALFTYKIWLEEMAKHIHPHIKIIDTSFGILGKRDDKSKIYVYPLSEIIGKVKKAANKKRRVNANPVLLDAALHSQRTRQPMSGGNGGTDVWNSPPTGRERSGGVSAVRPDENLQGLGGEAST